MLRRNLEGKAMPASDSQEHSRRRYGGVAHRGADIIVERAMTGMTF